jgi:hypothetical protein
MRSNKNSYTVDNWKSKFTSRHLTKDLERNVKIQGRKAWEHWGEKVHIINVVACE